MAETNTNIVVPTDTEEASADCEDAARSLEVIADALDGEDLTTALELIQGVLDQLEGVKTFLEAGTNT